MAKKKPDVVKFEKFLYFFTCMVSVKRIMMFHFSGVNCQIVSLGEDCALQSQDRTAGRRGLAGIVPTIKIAGALAQVRLI